MEYHFFLPNKLLARLAFLMSIGFLAVLPSLGPLRVSFSFSTYFVSSYCCFLFIAYCWDAFLGDMLSF